MLQLHDTELVLGKVVVSVSALPIERLIAGSDSDAIVSSDDTQLSMTGSVSRTVRNQAGEEVVEEAQRLVPLKVGDVAVTSAGRLRARYIFHAVTADRQLGINPSELTIRVAARNIFRRCELLRVTRVVIPPLTDPAGLLSADVSARFIVGALAEHVNNPTVIRGVVLCLPDDSERKAFSVYLRSARQGLSSDTIFASAPPQAALPGAGPTAPLKETQTGTAFQTRTTVGTIPKVRLTDRIKQRLGVGKEQHSTSTGEPAEPTRPKELTEVRDRRTLSSDSRPLVSNRYVLLEELGRGGMGIVFLAWDIVLRQTFAIKTLQPEARLAPQYSEALKREAALQIRLVHEGIVRLLNFEPRDPRVGPYILMEYMTWPSGDRWVAEAGTSGLPVPSVLTVGIRLCDALAYAHSADVLHGDIKPSNIFVDPTGDWAKLADFGISRVIGGRERNALVTRLVGTPSYMAPEQKALGARVGPQTDIYLLSRTLLELLGGHVDDEHRPQLPGDSLLQPVASVLKHGMAPDPRNRPADAPGFARLLIEARAAVT